MDKTLAQQIAELEEERDQLEKALPPHGLKPALLMKLEEVEDRLKALQARARKEENG